MIKLYKVGVTGGIGTGKSTICKIFGLLQVPVYHSDDKAKLLMVTDRGIISSLTTLLGNDIYLPDGSLNKNKLAAIIFSDSSARQKVNDIVHPRVWLDFDSWSKKFEGKNTYVIQESAILFETNRANTFDYIITTTCSSEEKIERILKRDSCTREQAGQRILSQIPDDEKAKRSNFVIETGRSILAIDQVINIHEQILKEISLCV